LGMLVIGCGYGILWRMAGLNPLSRPLAMLLYVVITVGGMIDMPEAVTVFASILSLIIMFGALFMLFVKPDPVPKLRQPFAPRVMPVPGRVND